MSGFDTWFRLQHGDRPGFDGSSDDDLREQIKAGHEAEHRLRMRELWDAKQTAALYAWQAAEVHIYLPETAGEQPK